MLDKVVLAFTYLEAILVCDIKVTEMYFHVAPSMFIMLYKPLSGTFK